MVSGKNRYILSLDCGTSGCKASIWDTEGRLLGLRTEPLRLLTPRHGFVEQNPESIWKTQLLAIRRVISDTGTDTADISILGLTNQRETVVAWDSLTGHPLCNAISWLDRRTAGFVSEISPETGKLVKEKTGLIVDPYFSAVKMKWLIEDLQKRFGKAVLNSLRFGTVDSWVIWKLTGGRKHVTDWSNASRTMLFDIRKGVWDTALLEIFGVDSYMLPEVVDSIDPGIMINDSLLGHEIPLGSVAGDQQASLFGHVCLRKGEVKNTYGTGTFLLANAGNEPPHTDRLISTVGWKRKGEKAVYAVEGSLFNTGSVMRWIKDNMHFIKKSSDSEKIARVSGNRKPLYFVPAFTGLGAPYWESGVKGAIFGITNDVTPAELVRGALESIAFRTRDIIETAHNEIGITLDSLNVDGKPTSNEFLMQFQADILGIPVITHSVREKTSAGAAYMAGIAEGVMDEESLKVADSIKRKFTPSMKMSESEELYRGWLKAVNSTLSMYNEK